MSRHALLTDAQWAQIEPLMPTAQGCQSPFRDHGQVVEGIIYRFRTGIAWRDLPGEFLPWQTVWKRHKRNGVDGTRDRSRAHLVALADANDEVEWDLSVSSTINRSHQRATTLTRTPLAGTGGSIELHEIGQRTVRRAS